MRSERHDLGVVLDQTDDPEDTTDSGGRADVDRFADFMRGLAPPPQLAQSSSARNGGSLFHSAGCDGCHVATLTTDSNPASFVPSTTGGVAISSSLNKALAGQTFHPYSDFLLHDMGSLGDGIISGAAGPTMMRTAPLWGVRAKSVLLHDGRASDLRTAITLHDGQGKAASDAFKALSPSQQTDLVNFPGNDLSQRSSGGVRAGGNHGARCRRASRPEAGARRRPQDVFHAFQQRFSSRSSIY